MASVVLRKNSHCLRSELMNGLMGPYVLNGESSVGQEVEGGAYGVELDDEAHTEDSSCGSSEGKKKSLEGVEQ